MNQLRIFPTSYFVLNLLDIIIRFINDVIWLLHDHVVTLLLTVLSIYEYFFMRIVFYVKQKICLKFGVSNIHSLLDMIYFNLKHLLKIWNVLFNKCYSGCMLKDLLGIIIMFPFCSICVSQEVWIMKKNGLHCILS